MPLQIILATPGTYTVDDDGIRGNGVSVVRDSSGAIISTIVHPADSVTFTTATAGVNLIFNVADTFGTANVTVGVLGDPTQSPESIVVKNLRSDAFITLVSNGSIAEGGADAPADIVAAGLVMSAGTGIATAGNALETQTTFIEAETNTGGLNIANAGNVQIGGLTAGVEGLNVATSGNLNFSTTGFIVLADTTGAQMVHGGDSSGNVTLTALGVDSDIFTTLNQKMVSAPGGGITLNAGRDVFAGTGGTNFDNDILATSFVTIHAGRDFVLDGTSDVRTGSFGGVVGGPILIQTGRNINLTNTTGGLQTIQAFAGDVTLTTGTGGSFFENAAFAGAVQSSGDIIVNADTVRIDSGGLNTTGIGSVTIRPVSPGRAIDIGSTVDSAGALSLSDAELDRMFTLNLNIGDANTGPVEFSAPVSLNVVPASLIVRSATEILVNSSIVLDGSLTLRAGSDLFFTAAGSFATSNGGFSGFVDDAQDDGGDGGTGTLGGTISTTTGIRLSGNVDNDALFGTGEADMLFGLGGSDSLTGNGGNDTLNGGTGADLMQGAGGNDLYYVDNTSDQVVETLGGGLDLVRSSVSFTLGADVEDLTLTGAAAIDGTGNTLGNRLYGNGAANTLRGGQGNDVVRGYGGNDFLYAGSNQDFLNGGAGNDWLEGGRQADRYTGDVGADVFVFRNGEFGGASAATADQIHDFSHAQADKIRLDFVDANTGVAGDQNFAFIGTAAFSGTAGQLRYEQISGKTFVQGDVNGDGAADFWISLDGLHALVGGDFVL